MPSRSVPAAGPRTNSAKAKSLPDEAEVAGILLDTDGNSTSFTDLQAVYSGYGASDLDSKGEFAEECKSAIRAICLEVHSKEDRVITKESFRLPLSDIRTIRHSAKPFRFEITKYDGARLVLTEKSLTQSSPEDKQTRSMPVHAYSFCAGKKTKRCQMIEGDGMGGLGRGGRGHILQVAYQLTESVW